MVNDVTIVDVAMQVEYVIAECCMRHLPYSGILHIHCCQEREMPSSIVVKVNWFAKVLIHT